MCLQSAVYDVVRLNNARTASLIRRKALRISKSGPPIVVKKLNEILIL